MNNKLISEFKMAGASNKEAEELALLGKNITNLFDFKRSSTAKQSFLDQYEGKVNMPEQKIYYKRLLFLLPALIILVLIFSSLLSVNASKPGDTLYPVKIYINNTFIKKGNLYAPSAHLNPTLSPVK